LGHLIQGPEMMYNKNVSEILQLAMALVYKEQKQKQLILKFYSALGLTLTTTALLQTGE
jgi:hypothetical protein